MNSHRSARCVLSLTLGLATIGCSKARDDLPREPVAGTVMMDGQPLPEAAIQFTPTGELKATAYVARVENGKFSIPREEGLVPGTYRVSISHAESVEVKSRVAAGPLTKKAMKLGKELIPSRYNTKSTLQEEIKAGGATDLKYEIQSK